MDPQFLTLAEVIEIHRDQIDRYGGSYGLLDQGRLSAAVAMPAATFGGQFLHTDLCEMAASYLYHIAQNHPFIDGNKRVAAVAADVFLALNGVRMTATENDYAEIVLSVASGETSKSALSEFLRANSAAP